MNRAQWDLAAQRAYWAGEVIREIAEVCSVRTHVAHEVVNRLRGAIDREEEGSAVQVLLALGVQRVTLENFCAAVRMENAASMPEYEG